VRVLNTEVDDKTQKAMIILKRYHRLLDILIAKAHLTLPNSYYSGTTYYSQIT
jgi:hypothetical protein